jgi:NAD(P)-dependent dehydrogenase (short-subunit alcohol dehydrogenase family)
MQLRLTDKVALISGAASGIGRAAALLFAHEGAAVAIADINQAGESVVEEIVRNGGRALFEQADVTQAVDCQRAVERTLHEFDGIHVLFNNAGIMRRASVVELSEEDPDHGKSRRRLHHQYGFRLGPGGRTPGCCLLCIERCGRTSD